MNNIFDTHTHYDDTVYDEDREELLSTYLPEHGVVGVVNVGAEFDDCFKCVDIAGKYDYIYAAVGVHPGCLDRAPSDYLDQLRELTKNKKVVAIGEIGLDYHYDDGAPRELQIKYFEEQIQLAQELDLPIIVHNREAHGDTMEILRKYKPKGIVHCYSGSVEMMKEIVSLGMSIGMGGTVTFKNARVPVEVASSVPLSNLVLETDAPYLAPVPFRGKRNDSSLISYVGEKIAEIRTEAGNIITPEELFKVTAQNAVKLFNIPMEIK